MGDKQGVALRFWLAGILVLTGTGLMVFLTARTAPSDEVKVGDLLENSRYDGRRVKVFGMVVKGSETYDVEKIELAFRIADRTGDGRSISVDCRQERPDAFVEEGDVIVTGIYDAKTGHVRGEEVMAKCPSRYEPDYEKLQEAQKNRPTSGVSTSGQP